MTGDVDKKKCRGAPRQKLGVLPLLFASMNTHRRWQNETVAPGVKNLCGWCHPLPHQLSPSQHESVV